MNLLERKWKNKDISDQEKVFLIHYALTDDMDEALKEAKFEESVLGWKGPAILGRDTVKAEFAAILAELGKSDRPMTQQEVEAEFRLLATVSITDFYDKKGEVKDVTKLDPLLAKAIKSVKRTVNPRTGAVTVELVLHDKLKALENLGRIGGYYAADNGQQSGDVNIQVVLPGGLANI